MKLKAFTRALQYAFLPTASLLLLLFFAFFDISDTIDFISSSHGGAIALRIIAFLAEVVLVVVLYYSNLKKLSIERAHDNKKHGIKVSYSDYIKNVMGGKSCDTYEIYDTDHINVKVLVRSPKLDL